MEQGRTFTGTENALLKAYKEAPSQERESLNLEIRRNIYDQRGKDLTADRKDKQTNGGEPAPNGTSLQDLSTKAIEEIVKEPKKPIYCYSCAVDCTRIRYHYAKAHPISRGQEAKIVFDICPTCYQNARYDDVHLAIDFVKIEDPSYSTVPDKDAPWTDSELLLLLEGLEKFDENWNDIADHVGSRTKEECVVKFLQLEIEDKYLEPEASSQPSYGKLENGRVPFTQSDNPVMSVLGFLAGMSEPAVAAAAAGQTVEAMRLHQKSRIENGIGGDSIEKGIDKESMKSEDLMDVDNPQSPRPDAPNQVALSFSESQQDPASFTATTAFAASAARAAALASNEEREMTRLVSAAVNTTLQKFELKLQQFSEMETLLQAERRELERNRQQLFLDRLAFRKRVSETMETLRVASLNGGQESAKMAQDVEISKGEALGFQPEPSTDTVESLSVGATGSQSYEI